MNLALAKALADLPPLLQPQNRRLYIEPVSDEARAAAAEIVARANAAKTAAFELSREVGATGFFPAGDRGGVPGGFVFSEKPAGRAWSKMPRYQGRGFGAYPSRTPEGKAIQARIDALPSYPAAWEFAPLAGLIESVKVSAQSHAGQYSYAEWSLSVGWEGRNGVIYTTVFGYTGERTFVVTPNPFADIANAAEQHPDLEVIDDSLSWRPAAGWQLRSKAEVDLAFAQAAVAAESEAA